MDVINLRKQKSSLTLEELEKSAEKIYMDYEK